MGTSYAYTAHDGLSSVTDANGSVTTYKYDDMGRVFQVVTPDTGTTTYLYDPAGNLVSEDRREWRDHRLPVRRR